MIDPHVHLRDWNLHEKDTLYHGLKTAAAAGFSHVFDMPNTDPPLTSADAVKRRLAEGEAVSRCIAEETGAIINYHLYGGLTADERQVGEMVRIYLHWRPAVAGFKLFAGHSTGNMGIIDPLERLKIFRRLSGEGYCGVAAVHCEKEELLRPDLYDPRDVRTHSAARPPAAETASVAEQLRLAAEAGFSGTLHICHISTLLSLELIEAARGKVPFRITCGITPHHALLDTSLAALPDNLLKVNPPLRDPLNRRKMFAALLEGRIDWIESDHAPHTLQQKRDGASGIPGFAGYLLLVRELERHGADPQLLADLTGRRAAEVFSLPLDSDGTANNRESFTECFAAAAAEYEADPYLAIISKLNQRQF